jgi:hypothetical protein
LLAAALVTTSGLLSADDQAAAGNDGKTVQVNMGGKAVPIRVSEVGDPLKNISVSASASTGKYDPERIFSMTSPMADKTFVFPSNSFSKGSDFNNRDQNAFLTKPYRGDVSSSVPNLDAKPSFRTAAGYNRSATGFDKSYETSTSDVSPNRMAALGASNASADQNRAAVLGGPEKPEPMTTDAMAHKSYQDPALQHVTDYDAMVQDKIVISRMSGLPNRSLSIDEVRDLINHGTTPDTNVKPEESGKPLNDPEYKPKPLRDMPPPGSSDDDKDDPVPPPGTMAAPQAPENSEPLPQP